MHELNSSIKNISSIVRDTLSMVDKIRKDIQRRSYESINSDLSPIKEKFLELEKHITMLDEKIPEKYKYNCILFCDSHVINTGTPNRPIKKSIFECLDHKLMNHAVIEISLSSFVDNLKTNWIRVVQSYGNAIIDSAN